MSTLWLCPPTGVRSVSKYRYVYSGDRVMQEID
jgi:hypothetical protein